jgi:hypothetical protein
MRCMCAFDTATSRQTSGITYIPCVRRELEIFMKTSFSNIVSFRRETKGPATQPRTPLHKRSIRGQRKGLKRIRLEEGDEAYELARTELYAELEARKNSVAKAA